MDDSVLRNIRTMAALRGGSMVSVPTRIIATARGEHHTHELRYDGLPVANVDTIEYLTRRVLLSEYVHGCASDYGEEFDAHGDVQCTLIEELICPKLKTLVIMYLPLRPRRVIPCAP